MSSVGQKMSFNDVLKWSEGILSPSSHTPAPAPASRGDKAPYSMIWVIGAVVVIIAVLLLYMWYSNRAATASGSGSASACATPPPAQSSSPPLPSPSMPGVPSLPLPPRT